MTGKNGRQYRKEKNQFRPSYCVQCLQNRVCEEFQFEEENICCPCRVARAERQQKLNSYQKLVDEGQAERERHRNHLRAQDEKNGKDWQKWYQKRGGIDYCVVVADL